MIHTSIGENAGKIWQILSDNGEMLYSELLEISEISEQELLMAIGWLSREAKINQSNSFTKNWKICLIYNQFSYGF